MKNTQTQAVFVTASTVATTHTMKINRLTGAAPQGSSVRGGSAQRKRVWEGSQVRLCVSVRGQGRTFVEVAVLSLECGRVRARYPRESD